MLTRERQDGALPRRPPDLQLPRRRSSTRTTRSSDDPTTSRRRTCGSTAATSSSGGRSSTTSREGEDLVEEPFRRLIAEDKLIALPVRRLLGADGHAQGQAAPRRAARERPRALGARGSVGRRPGGAPTRPAPGLMLALRSTGRRTREVGYASSRSAPTPTTSRSAAAARSSGSPRRIPTRRCPGSCSAPSGDARGGGAGERRGVPRGLRRVAACVVDELPRRLPSLRRRRGEGVLRGLEGRDRPRS